MQKNEFAKYSVLAKLIVRINATPPAHLAALAHAESGRLGQIARDAFVPLLLDIFRARRGFDAHVGAEGGGDAVGLQGGLALRGER